MEINRSTDGLGRPAGFVLDEGYAMSYDYDMFGRFHSVSSSVQSVSSVVEYSRLTNTDLISGMTASSGFLWTRAYESGRSLITAVENRYGETVISRYDYTNDALGRRTSRADSGNAFAAQPTYGDPATVEMPAYNAYSYNTRSEVTGAARRWGTPDASGDLVLGQQYAYAFDSIGNRITSAEGDASRTASYTANALNQYTQRTVPGEKNLIGTAPTNVAVTVNQNPVSRQFAYWHHALEVDNSTDAAYPHVAITAVYNPPGTNDPDVVTSQTGNVFVAKTPEAFQYDDDGNLIKDGRFTYTWNGENRLISATTRDELPASVPRVKVEYAYDHQGRMVWKEISRKGAKTQSWETEKAANFIWDGYNIVQELVTDNGSLITTNAYVWGLDLSGTLQGAGGVGGLLAEVQDGEPYFATFDANGNVTEYLSDNGTLAAHYEYSPFGEIVVQSGDLAVSFTHRFSTKPWCAVTGLSEYEMRKYGPGMGRWLSMDPIGELGALEMSIERSLTSGAFLETWGGMIVQPEVLRKFERALKRRSRAEETGANRHLYLFVHNSSIVAIDPDGFGWLAWFVKLLAELAPIAEDVALSSEANEHLKGQKKCEDAQKPDGCSCCVMYIGKRVANATQGMGVIHYRYYLLTAYVVNKPCDKVVLPKDSLTPPDTKHLNFVVDW